MPVYRSDTDYGREVARVGNRMPTREEVARRKGFAFLSLQYVDRADADGLIHAIQMAARREMSRAGIGEGSAKSMTGAFGELIDNVFDHSLAANTGIASFARVDDQFEIAVADCGQGALAGYQNHPDFPEVRDEADALTLAVRDHVSRHGRASGRGTGFKTLIRALSSLDASVRVRSGDQALTIQGTAVNRALAVEQKARLRGFVASARFAASGAD